MKKHLQVQVIGITLFLSLTACSTLDLFRDATRQKPPSHPPSIHAASIVPRLTSPVFGIKAYMPDIRSFWPLPGPSSFPDISSPTTPIPHPDPWHRIDLPAALALLLIYFFYRLQARKKAPQTIQKIQSIPLDRGGLALIDLIIITLRDLLHRLQTKLKPKFPLLPPGR